jgi:hypothetical protein
MPTFTIRSPLYDKLPKELYDGAFQAWIAPGADYEHGRPCGYYFLDRTWWCSTEHLVGWSREILHTLKIDSWTHRVWLGVKPNWLCGHAFELEGTAEPLYRVSGTTKRLHTSQLIGFAQQALQTLGEADCTYDQWGGTEDRHWLSAIQKHMEERKEQHWALEDHIERHGHLDAFVRDQNHRNKLWHPKYPIQGPVNTSGIGQTYCNTFLNAGFQAGTFTGAATIFSALHSVTPSDTSDGTEAAYTGYARQSITCNSTNFPNAAAGAITYGPIITFPTNTGSSETEAAVSWQALSSGGTQPNWWGTLSTTVAVGNGIAPQFNASAIITSGV